jgi:ABC-2 type transport system ATP-binding protein
LSSDFIVTSQALSKRFQRDVLAVDAIDLHVPRGHVYGLLGSNGAGKTTTLRMLVGLTKPTSGSALVVGHPAGSHASRRRVGALLERFGFFPYLSGRDNLRLIARYCGLDDRHVQLALEEVGMAAESARRYGTYSLGMQQRIALGSVLMREPELIVLDEPTNGLDPQGILEVRTLVREIARGGRTVLLSSHHLSEVEQVCDTLGVIRRGRLVAEGPVGELRGGRSLLLRAAPAEQAVRVLSAVLGPAQVSRRGDYVVVSSGDTPVRAISHTLATCGVDILALREQARSLEDIFFELTAGAEPRSA